MPIDETSIEHFLEFGYLRVPQGLPEDLRQREVEKIWVRLGADPNDPATWPDARYRMGVTERWPYRDATPAVWDKACALLGGEDRINTPVAFGNGILINFSHGVDEGWQPPDPDCGGWHKDGDFFKHFLDSPEQGLLVLILWDDIAHQGGGTFFAADSPGVVARWFAERPEGSWGAPAGELVRECTDFREVTGKAGDVFLLHPFMIHAHSHNVTGKPRLLTNPCISLREPMQFDRDDAADCSAVERVVLNALGVERFAFKPTTEREKKTPARVGEQDSRRAEELQRLAAAGYAVAAD